MQRFKDFTKKSGKVASAILSAAMVTSMVAGTNVVYAATETTKTTEATTDVEGVNSDREAVETAQAEITALLSKVSVNAKTAKEDFVPSKNEKLLEITKKYAVTMSSIQYVVTEESGANKDGASKLTFNLKKDSYNNDVTIPYTIDSATKRAAAAKEAVETGLKKDFAVNNLSKNADLEKAVEEILKAYPDVDLATSGASLNIKPYATATADGAAKGSANLRATATNGDYIDTVANYSATIENNTTRINKASELVKTYLETDLRYADSEVFATTGTAVQRIVDNYLKANKYLDIKTATGIDTDYENVKKESQNQDGEGKVKFRLATVSGAAVKANGDADSTQVVSKDTTDVKVTLLSEESKANKALADLMAVAEKIEPTSETTEAAFMEDFGKTLDADYKVYKQDSSKAAYATTSGAVGIVVNFGSTETDGDQDSSLPGGNVYTGDVVANLKFTQKDASAGKDGDPKVEIEVSAGGKETARDKKVYTIDSAQTNANKAKAAVEAALANMAITNDTTDEDVLAVVNETLKDYPDVKAEIVTFDKTDATADKEGTATIKVKLTNTRNGISKEAVANRKFNFYCNTFVEKDGKKYYYGKDGKLATTDQGYFLQGTDSPDGYTYFVQNDGSVMQDRITYHPDGEHVIYFDKDGHEVFDAFVNVKADALGQPVDYIGYFDTFGYAYVNQTTYGNGEGAYAKDALFYINDYGVLENKGWFQNAAGEIGYAATNGTLTTSQWSLDQFGRKVYFQANGFLAKGLMTDGVKYYQLDETDGHLVGEF